MSDAHGPIEERHRKIMNQMATVIDTTLNPNEAKRTTGFVLLMFSFDDAVPSPARMNYISNAERADMLVALKELVANFEGRMMPDARQQ